MKELSIENRHPECRLRSQLFRSFCRWLLKQEPIRSYATEGYLLNILLLPDEEMQKWNRELLQHEGTTDVISLTYHDDGALPKGILCGDILVNPDEAQRQAPRYQTTPSEELARYVIHGLLHLCGWEDTTPEQRRAMRIEEDRLLVEARKYYTVDSFWERMNQRKRP